MQVMAKPSSSQKTPQCRQERSQNTRLRGKQRCATEWGCGLEDSSTPAMELEHHAQVCPVGLPVSRRMLQAPFPFSTLLISPWA